MATVTFLLNPARPEAVSLVERSCRHLEAGGHSARVLRLPTMAAMEAAAAGSGTGEVPARPPVDVLHDVDLAVSVGGDGTFLRLVPLAYTADVPVLGINFGRLGYLLEVQPSQVDEALEQALAGKVELEDRTLLEIRAGAGLSPLPTDDRSLGQSAEGSTWVALNEMAVEKTVPGHMVHLTTTVDGEPCFSYRADGVLVATATGSTGYNLSAGGPVLAPSMRSMVVTPVAPHLSIDRSLVLEPDSSVTIRVEESRPAVLVVDGRAVGRLSPGAVVECRIAPRPIRFVSLGHRGFASLLVEALAPTPLQ